MALQSISKYCDLNLSGLRLVEYVPSAWVDVASYERIISGGNNWVYDISFNTGDWMTLPVIPSNDLWDERQRSNDQGPFYQQSVSGVAPALRPSVTGQFGEMAHYRFLIRITDKKSQKWLIGTLSEPLRFEADAGTGGSNNGNNNYGVRFFRDTPRRAVGFSPVL